MFQDYTKDGFDKCVSLEETNRKLEQIIRFPCSLNTKRYTDFLYSSSIVANDDPSFVFWGKGITKLASEVSALCELIERISSAQFPIYFNRFTKRYNELLRFSRLSWVKTPVDNRYDRVYDSHISDFNGLIEPEYKVGYSILKRKEVLLDLNKFLIVNGSNGVASGNTIEEAFIQATCEVFERYCCSNILLYKHKHELLDKSYITNPVIIDLLAYYDSQHYDTYVMYIGNGYMPAYAILFEDKDRKHDDPLRYTFVCASSFNSDIAIIRCLTEKAQLGLKGKSYKVTNSLRSIAELAKTSLDLSFLKTGNPRPYKLKIKGSTLREIDAIGDIVREFDTDAVFVDCSLMGFPVAISIVPGMSEMTSFYGKEQMIAHVKEGSKHEFLLNYVRS